MCSLQLFNQCTYTTTNYLLKLLNLDHLNQKKPKISSIIPKCHFSKLKMTIISIILLILCAKIKNVSLQSKVIFYTDENILFIYMQLKVAFLCNQRLRYVLPLLNVLKVLTQFVDKISLPLNNFVNSKRKHIINIISDFHLMKANFLLEQELFENSIVEYDKAIEVLIEKVQLYIDRKRKFKKQKMKKILKLYSQIALAFLNKSIAEEEMFQIKQSLNSLRASKWICKYLIKNNMKELNDLINERYNQNKSNFNQYLLEQEDLMRFFKEVQIVEFEEIDIEDDSNHADINEEFNNKMFNKFKINTHLNNQFLYNPLMPNEPKYYNPLFVYTAPNKIRNQLLNANSFPINPSNVQSTLNNLAKQVKIIPNSMQNLNQDTKIKSDVSFEDRLTQVSSQNVQSSSLKIGGQEQPIFLESTEYQKNKNLKLVKRKMILDKNQPQSQFQISSNRVSYQGKINRDDQIIKYVQTQQNTENKIDMDHYMKELVNCQNPKEFLDYNEEVLDKVNYEKHEKIIDKREKVFCNNYLKMKSVSTPIQYTKEMYKTALKQQIEKDGFNFKSIMDSKLDIKKINLNQKEIKDWHIEQRSPKKQNQVHHREATDLFQQIFLKQEFKGFRNLSKIIQKHQNSINQNNVKSMKDTDEGNTERQNQDIPEKKRMEKIINDNLQIQKQMYDEYQNMLMMEPELKNDEKLHYGFKSYLSELRESTENVQNKAILRQKGGIKISDVIQTQLNNRRTALTRRIPIEQLKLLTE